MLTLRNIAAIIFIFISFQQPVIAQSFKNYEMDTYSKFILIVFLILIATIFIGFTILDDPKYMVSKPVEKKPRIAVNNLTGDIKYDLDNKVLHLFRMGLYTIILLSTLYLILMILMLKVI